MAGSPTPLRGNASHQGALTELNRQRIYRKMTESAAFVANEKTILATLMECPRSPAPAWTALRTIGALVKRENIDRLKRLGAGAHDPRHGLHDMQELDFVRELTEIDMAARLAGVSRDDWSMAMEKGSLAFFDGILSGIYGPKSYYLKEDLIYEMLRHLAGRERRFARHFAADAVFAAMGYPFGHRIDMGPALASCPLLVPRRPHPATRDRVAGK